MPLNIVLLQPEIPQNTGNIARTCACIGARLHLVAPLGFQLSEQRLRRAGLDYWDDVDIIRHDSTRAFFETVEERELHLFTGKASRGYHEVSYGSDAYLVFGRESRGIDEDVLAGYADQCVRIPMRAGERSLNLANSVAIGVYEALRQSGFSSLQ